MIVLRKTILNLVNANPGMKGTDLVAQTIHDFVLGNMEIPSRIQYEEELESLVKAGEIVELEYVLPTMDYRIKTMYFPQGTLLFCYNLTVNDGTENDEKEEEN